jgi:hypothetical protein
LLSHFSHAGSNSSFLFLLPIAPIPATAIPAALPATAQYYQNYGGPPPEAIAGKANFDKLVTKHKIAGAGAVLAKGKK